MSLEFESDGPRNIMLEDFLLREQPFRISTMYNPDKPDPYEPLMYGKQHGEFYEKFFIQPLQRKTNKQVIGSIWSTQTAADWRGFGKSTLMAEESKGVCRDFGFNILRSFKVKEENAKANPILAGYCTFDESKEIKSFAAALLDAVCFILEQPFDTGELTVHQELRRRIAERNNAEEDFEGESVRNALRKQLRSYKTLNVQLNHKTLDQFIEMLSGADTEALTAFIRNEIGPRIKAKQGFNFVHVFNAYALCAGIVSVTYFIDQIENFAKWARNQDREVKILRESMVQTSPTSEMASFVFQMHVSALQEIEDWWEVAEHLPSLDFEKPINRTRTINLLGLRTTDEAKTLAARYLKEYRPVGVKEPKDPLHPFPEDVIKMVRDSTRGNPRKFLETLGQILEHAVSNNERVIDLTLVEPLLGDDYQDTSEEVEGDDDFENEER
jgi:hypothetical protein